MLTTNTRHQTLPAASCPPPLHLFRQLRGTDGSKGLCLLESCGPQLPTTRRSVVGARALLRLELRQGQASFTVLQPEAEALLDLLAEGLESSSRQPGQLQVQVPAVDLPTDCSDEERLLAPGVLDLVRKAAGLLADSPNSKSPLAPGLFGTFSYDLVDQFESLPPRAEPQSEVDASFVLISDMVIYERDQQQVHVLTRGLPWEEVVTVEQRHRQTVQLLQEMGPQPEPPLPARPAGKTAETDLDSEDFQAAVQSFRQHIAKGDIFQGVLSRRMRVQSQADPLDVYYALRCANPSPYLFFLDLAQGSLLGASPETFLRVEQGEVEIRPIAGTVPRGLTDEGEIDVDMDNRLALQLLLDKKEQAEHAMLLDLARNDVARVSVAGSCRVTQQFSIEKYSHVQHLVSRVRGRLQQGLDALHAYRAAANMGTLTGAPKLRAMELIRQSEPTPRGFYGGAAGYFLQDGSFDSCIVIRSLRHQDHNYETRAGAGVVWDSNPALEFQETEHKARACLQAIATAECMTREEQS